MIHQMTAGHPFWRSRSRPVVPASGCSRPSLPAQPPGSVGPVVMVWWLLSGCARPVVPVWLVRLDVLARLFPPGRL